MSVAARWLITRLKLVAGIKSIDYLPVNVSNSKRAAHSAYRLSCSDREVELEKKVVNEILKVLS